MTAGLVAAAESGENSVSGGVVADETEKAVSETVGAAGAAAIGENFAFGAVVAEDAADAAGASVAAGIAADDTGEPSHRASPSQSGPRQFLPDSDSAFSRPTELAPSEAH